MYLVYVSISVSETTSVTMTSSGGVDEIQVAGTSFNSPSNSTRDAGDADDDSSTYHIITLKRP